MPDLAKKMIPASGRAPAKDRGSFPMNVHERSEVGHSSSSEKRRMKNVRKSKFVQGVKGKSNKNAKVFKAHGFSFGAL